MVITIQDLKKKFPVKKGGPPIDALKGLNLTIEKGEVFGIIGMSGSGKSTLIRCLTGLETPSEGSIQIGGIDIATLSGDALREARQKIGMIFQHFNLFTAKRAWENVAYPLEIEGMSIHERKKRALDLLTVVGLKHKSESYPEQLSGGEKQRVAIARALARNPEVLFCDEGTSALDPTTTQSILSLLAQLNKNLGITIVLITHEMEVVKQLCTQVAVLHAGEIVEIGKVEAIFASPIHPVTRRLLANLTYEVPAHFYPRREDSLLLRLFFQGGEAGKPIISRMIKSFEVEVNILLGGIDVLRNETIGHLVVELSGNSEERKKAREFLEESGVRCEEIIDESQ